MHMPFDVSTADIETRWRVLSTEEEDVGLQRLLDAERKLRLLRPKLLATYTDLDAGDVKDDLLETIRAVLAGVVIRYLRNPDVNNRQDIGADGSIGIGFDTLTPGGLYFTAEELNEIDQAAAVATEVPLSPFVSRRLISSFPYRSDTGDPTILPTP
jgi:hypothetical protein